MTHIEKMLEELERRNYSQSTVRAYRMTISDLEQYCKRPAHQLKPEQVRQYQAHLFFATGSLRRTRSISEPERSGSSSSKL